MKYPRSGPDLARVRKLQGEVKNTGTLANTVFIKACKIAGIEPTKRQASKWNHGKGKAYAERFEARRL